MQPEVRFAENPAVQTMQKRGRAVENLYPRREVRIEGRQIARDDVICHRDGTQYRYVGMARGNTVVAAIGLSAQDVVKYFGLGDFKITVETVEGPFGYAVLGGGL